MKMLNVLLVVLCVSFGVFPAFAACEQPVVTFVGQPTDAGGYDLEFFGYASKPIIASHVFIDGQPAARLVPQLYRRDMSFPDDYPAQMQNPRSEFHGKINLAEDGQYAVRVKSWVGKCAPKNETVRVNAYDFQYDRAFQSSDHGVTVRFYVTRLFGRELSACPNGTGTCMPTYIAMRVDGMLVSSGLSVIDEPNPYLLYNFFDTEYAQIAGRTLDVIFYVFEKPYHFTVLFGQVE